jgi:hypothetical protein
MAGYITRIADMKSVCKILIRKPEGKSPIGRPVCRWKDDIKTDIKEIVWKVVNLIYVAQNRDRWRALLNTVMNLLVSKKEVIS